MTALPVTSSATRKSRPQVNLTGILGAKFFQKLFDEMLGRRGAGRHEDGMSTFEPLRL